MKSIGRISTRKPFHSFIPNHFPVLCGILFSGIQILTGQSLLDVGDIQVTGVTSDASDSFSFVLWKNISSGTVIRFTDQSFTDAGTSLNGGENDMSVRFDSDLSAGSLIRIEAGGTALTNGGTFVGITTGSLGGIANAGDQVFAYQGAAVGGSGTSFTGRTALYGFNIGSSNWVTSGASSNNSVLPTSLSGINANLDSKNFDNADYTAASTGMTQAAYKAAIVNVDNFTHSDTRFDLRTSGFTITTSLDLIWDANGKTSGTGGAGTWDAITQSRFSNSNADTYLHWVDSNSGNSHTAVFGGTAGIVTVSNGITASGLKFDVDSYTLTGGSIVLMDPITP
ncbi:MAG: hypothetical protein H8M99_09900, partial [Gloeobacteraceae cyanobacterium ES-bin-144]|nr:hypothetical protein [Verrucomicrobiales bacterium]